MNGNCFSPKQARQWMEEFVKEQGREVDLDR